MNHVAKGCLVWNKLVYNGEHVLQGKIDAKSHDVRVDDESDAPPDVDLA